MVAKRIIPCLDIKGGRTVKGTRFVDLRDVGDPVQLAHRYSEEGADELVFLDISASEEESSTTIDVVRSVAKAIAIPFTVGGGISSASDVSRLLSAGADKVSVNSSAISNPDLIDTLAREFGSQCVVVAIDSKLVDGDDCVFARGGKVATGLSTRSWANEVTKRGAGEILLTSMDRDGTRSGYDLRLLRDIATMVNVPVIASGGAGDLKDFLDLFRCSDIDAALVAGLFHDGITSVCEVKEFLAKQGIEVRR
jgi:cyclase